MSEWDAWFGTQQLPNATDWTFEMPQQGDLLKFNPSLTGQGLQQLLDLGQIGGAMSGGPMPTIPNFNLQSNLRGSPALAGLYGTEGPANPAGTGRPTAPNFMQRTGSAAMDLIKKNPAAFLAMLGAGGAGIAGAVKGSQRAKLPGEVQDLVKRATAPQGPDPYEQAELDRQMRRDLGPGWETSTPGIQAKSYQNYLRQKGDQGQAAAALGPVGSLYAQKEAQQSQEQQSLFQLAALLGTLGLGAFGSSR